MMNVADESIDFETSSFLENMWLVDVALMKVRENSDG